MRRVLLALLLLPFFAKAQIITTIAGTGAAGYSGDGGPAIAATLNNPAHIVFDANGNLYFSDYHNNVIRKINKSGIISTIAGNTSGVLGYSGDGGPASAATLNGPNGMSIDSAGNIFFADQENNVIRKIDISGIITTVAGNGNRGIVAMGVRPLQQN